MKVVKRWGVMTLVALLVLGTMSAALADDGVETETAKPPLEADSYVPYLDWADGLVQFVFFWGFDVEDGEIVDGPECPAPGPAVPSSVFGLFDSTLVTEVGDCVFLNVEKNGHYNHGSMVSSFVHWLKDGNLEVLLEELEASDSILNLQELRDMPKGQLVKEFAHLEFGKGFFELLDPDGLAAAEVGTEDADRHGPPASVMDKKAEKAAKGKNK